MEQDTILQRLSIVKVLFDEAKKQSLRDAVENFIVLIIESDNIYLNKFRPNFFDKLLAIKDNVNNFYFNNSSMSRFNTTRNNFKHQGIIPNKLNID